jgi:hypothetical protein
MDLVQSQKFDDHSVHSSSKMELMAILFIVHPKWKWCNHGGWVTEAKISLSGTINHQPASQQPTNPGLME